MANLKDALPMPEQCDLCCSLNIRFVSNSRIYRKPYGEWPYIWYCEDCSAAVGCHKNTRYPLGRMADRVTRSLRIKAHDEFDKLWRSGLMSRSKAYNWLASELNIDPSMCHISQLSKDQLKDVATLSADYLRINYKALVRRKAKKDDQRKQSVKRSRDDEFRENGENKRARLSRARRSITSSRTRSGRY